MLIPLGRIVEKLASLLLPTKGQIINKQRFYDEFGDEDSSASKKDSVNANEKDADETKKKRKPEDYEAIFTGNTDDSFRLGIAIAKRTLKVLILYLSCRKKLLNVHLQI